MEAGCRTIACPRRQPRGLHRRRDREASRLHSVQDEAGSPARRGTESIMDRERRESAAGCGSRNKRSVRGSMACHLMRYRRCGQLLRTGFRSRLLRRRFRDRNGESRGERGPSLYGNWPTIRRNRHIPVAGLFGSRQIDTGLWPWRLMRHFDERQHTFFIVCS